MGLSRRKFTTSFKPSRRKAARARVVSRRSGTSNGSQPQRAAPLAARVSRSASQCVSGQWEAAVVRRTGPRVGAQDRAAGAGDRFLEGLLAAHRRTADAAGIEWESAVFRRISEESASLGARLFAAH